MPKVAKRLDAARTAGTLVVCSSAGRRRAPRESCASAAVRYVWTPPSSRNAKIALVSRRRFHLSHAHVQMARELGMNPKKLGKIDNHDQEPWKAPLPQFIEHLYEKRFGRERPEVVMSVEERARAKDANKAARARTALD